MKSLAALLLALVLCPALAQTGPGRPQGEPLRPMQRDSGHAMPPPERRMGWEERQRLREEVRSGNISRDEARQRWRDERERRGLGPGRSPEERQRMRRDVQDANRALEKR